MHCLMSETRYYQARKISRNHYCLIAVCGLDYVVCFKHRNILCVPNRHPISRRYIRAENFSKTASL